jgi:transposase InsO family protein
MAFTAFVIDVFSRRIAGWRTAASMPPSCLPPARRARTDSASLSTGRGSR